MSCSLSIYSQSLFLPLPPSLSPTLSLGSTPLLSLSSHFSHFSLLPSLLPHPHLFFLILSSLLPPIAFYVPASSQSVLVSTYLSFFPLPRSSFFSHFSAFSNLLLLSPTFFPSSFPFLSSSQFKQVERKRQYDMDTCKCIHSGWKNRNAEYY